jgi:molybdopterin molybdotransferase
MKPLLSVDAALSALLNAAQPVSATENVPTLAANHRVLAHDLVSPMNVPQQPTSAMDGYAVGRTFIKGKLYCSPGNV